MHSWILPVTRWGARLLSLLLVFYVVRETEAYILKGGFPDRPTAFTAVALLILMVVGLVVAWTRELAGAVLALASWAAFVVIVRPGPLGAAVAFAVPAVLFLLDYQMRRHKSWHMR